MTKLYVKSDYPLSPEELVKSYKTEELMDYQNTEVMEMMDYQNTEVMEMMDCPNAEIMEIVDITIKQAKESPLYKSTISSEYKREERTTEITGDNND